MNWANWQFSAQSWVQFTIVVVVIAMAMPVAFSFGIHGTGERKPHRHYSLIPLTAIRWVGRSLWRRIVMDVSVHLCIWGRIDCNAKYWKVRIVSICQVTKRVGMVPFNNNDLKNSDQNILIHYFLCKYIYRIITRSICMIPLKHYMILLKIFNLFIIIVGI